MALLNVDIDLLRTLVTVGETNNFTLAGKRLFRTQSAISLQIKRLEEIAGEQLVTRGKQIELTSAGEVVRSYASEILNLNDKLIEQLGSRTETKLLRIGTPDDYAQLFLPAIIKEFTRVNTNVEFQIVSDLSINLSQMVEEGELDLAFVTQTEGLHGLEISSEPLTWVARPGFDIVDDQPIKLAVFPAGCEVRRLGTQALDRAGLRWDVACSSKQFMPLRAVIAAGDAIGILPSRAVPRDLLRVGSEYGLPDLPSANLLVKIASQANPAVQQLGATILRSFSQNLPFDKSIPAMH